jgi:hypothetical protein
LIEDNAKPPRLLIEIERAVASRTSLCRRRSFWDALSSTAAAAAELVGYQGYSYSRRADLYRLELSDEQRATLVAAAAQAPRNLLRELAVLERAARIVFICPRSGA